MKLIYACCDIDSCPRTIIEQSIFTHCEESPVMYAISVYACMCFLPVYSIPWAICLFLHQHYTVLIADAPQLTMGLCPDKPIVN